MLYWFRTPPGVRVGRSAIDEEAIRLIEQHNPEIQFDWSRILREPSPSAPPRKEERREERKEERRARDHRAASRDTRPSARPPAAPPEHPATEDAEYPNKPAADDADDAEKAAPSDTEPTEAAPTEYVEPEALDRLGTEEPAGIEPLDREQPREPVSAAESRLGPEGLARLRARYAEIMARITERPLEEDAREQLKQRAERLNPDTWVTADEVARALEVYEAVYEELRALVGTPHRQRRRGRGRRGVTGGGQNTQV